MPLANAVHGGPAHNIVKAGNLKPRDVRLEDLQRQRAQRFRNRLLAGDRQTHLAADAGIKFGMPALNLEGDGLQLDVDVADGGAAGQVGHAAQALEAQPPAEQAALFDPGADVLTAQTLRLEHRLNIIWC
jgi:hypothetical protein